MTEKALYRVVLKLSGVYICILLALQLAHLPLDMNNYDTPYSSYSEEYEESSTNYYPVFVCIAYAGLIYLCFFKSAQIINFFYKDADEATVADSSSKFEHAILLGVGISLAAMAIPNLIYQLFSKLTDPSLEPSALRYLDLIPSFGQGLIGFYLTYNHRKFWKKVKGEIEKTN